MNPAYLMLALSAAIAMYASISIHRYCGLCAIAAGGAWVNYFFMNPVYSFRISQTGDIAALSVYGVFGLFVTLHQTKNSRPHLSSRDRATLLDAYHFGLLMQLCSEINKVRGASVDLREVLNVALQRLRQEVDLKRADEILEDIRSQLEYEKWAASKLSGGQDEPLRETDFGDG
ncbi:MAG: hypothetical protein DLM73_06160 [Chthoniobacterales bacterium]|nr:MAG: hypothetical protein DLM73_06160 [Chthoniobacterales bacterium]